ncbi:MAG: hypothetical protein JRG91_11760 [Deltaproteobacteria bacterium]|nr:hypothetical protein [Deltaproteobacteria bacterium]
MILFKEIDGWIDQCGACFARVGSSRYRIGSPPEDLPGVDVLLCGQPGSGKSTLGNLMLGYRKEPLFASARTAAETPRFQEDMVSLARRFPDRYKGVHTIPVSRVQAATLPSLPAGLGVRFTEIWGMSAGERSSRGAMMEKILDAHPETGILVLVVRADQQLDAPERRFLEEIVPSPWKDSVVIVLNLRSTGHDGEEIIKLKGFVEEQCIGLGLTPRGVFALDARSGSSPVEGETARFGDAMTEVLIRLWTPQHTEAISGMLSGPALRLERSVLDGLELEEPTARALAEEIESTGSRIDEAMGRHGRVRESAIKSVEKLAARITLEIEEDLEVLSGSEVTQKPREVLQRFRRESIKEIERTMGECRDTSTWPVPDLTVRSRPGPGCMPIGAAVISAIVTIAVTIATLWILTGVFAAVTAGFVVLTVLLTMQARKRWRAMTVKGFRSVLDDQVEAARATIERKHGALADPSTLVPELSERLERLEGGNEAVSELGALSSRIGSLVTPALRFDKLSATEQGDATALGDATAHVPAAGHHARRLAAALAPGEPLNAFFHENGFDLDAPDLFARVCDIEYTLRPLVWLQSVQTVRDWLRPPLAKRERAIYPYLDRLRLRWDEAAQGTRALASRIVRKAGDGTGHPAVKAETGEADGPGPRIAIPEEALEAIIARILDEAARHARTGQGSKAAILLRWSLGTGKGDEKEAILDVEMSTGRGFDEAGRKAFDSGRGGLARFLADTDRGALGWCSRIEIASRDDDDVWTRAVHETAGRFTKTADVEGVPSTSSGTRIGVEGSWDTRFRLVFPAVIAEDA